MKHDERIEVRVARVKQCIARAYRHEEGVVPWLVVRPIALVR